MKFVELAELACVKRHTINSQPAWIICLDMYDYQTSFNCFCSLDCLANPYILPCNSFTGRKTPLKMTPKCHILIRRGRSIPLVHKRERKKKCHFLCNIKVNEKNVKIMSPFMSMRTVIEPYFRRDGDNTEKMEFFKGNNDISHVLVTLS